MNYRDGSIVLDLHDEVLGPILRGPSRDKALESIACHDDVIQHVMDQVMEGMTVNGCGGWADVKEEPQTAISKARRRIVEGADKVARDEVARLARDLGFLNGLYQRLRDELAAVRRGE